MKNFLTVVCGVLIIAALGVGVYTFSSHYATMLERQLVKDASLLDLDGKIWDVSRLGEKIGIVYFGYTSCPDICPTTLNSLGIALSQMKQKRDAFQPIFVSIDPDRDKPDIMREYTLHFDKNILSLTGQKSQLKSFAWTLGAHYSLRERDGAGDDYIVDHSVNLFVLTSSGRVLILPKKEDPEELKNLLIRTEQKLNKPK